MMKIEEKLRERSADACELCGISSGLEVYNVPPASSDPEKAILICQFCTQQLQHQEDLDVNHWRCLNTSAWSTVPAVQVVAWRLLYAMRHEGWTQDLLDMLYLDDETLAWAKSGISEEPKSNEKIIHKDSNGTVLLAGDTVTLIKDLDVKGGGFTAKRGTPVRGITLVESNAEHIEGKINGQQIIILTKFVKKAG